jgi:hypothetical protein
MSDQHPWWYILVGKVLVVEVIVTKVLVGAGIGFILADKPTTIVFSIFKRARNTNVVLACHHN